VPERAAFAVLALLLVVPAFMLTTTWVDYGDGTCGAVYRPDLSRDGCLGRIAWRAVGALAFATLAGASVIYGWRAAGRGGR